MNIKTVTVIGANGTIGSNVAGIFASFGDAKVYMVCRKMEDSEKAVKKVVMSVKAASIRVNLIPKDYSELNECLMKSDFVFESVSENIDIKKSIYNMITHSIKKGTIIGTGTSGLSINQLSENISKEHWPYFMGIHFYNPPYNMVLCEIIPSKYTDKKIVEQVKLYLTSVLCRNVVELKDFPAFLGNRIGFHFINKALQYAEKYKSSGGIDYIDAIFGGFTGRNMPPIVTSDFVGLDVHKAIIDNIYINGIDFAHETFAMPEYIQKLIDRNKLGKKTGCGLYQTIINDDGIKTSNVYDIVTDGYRKRRKYNFSFAQKMIDEIRIGNYNSAIDVLVKDDSIEAKICKKFMVEYVVYSLVMSNEIGFSIYDADDVMASGFNWIPPLALVDAFGGNEAFIKFACEQEINMKIDYQNVLKNLPHSKYDFRPFFKAK